MSPRWPPDPNIRRGRSVVSNLHAHLVFVTKYRRGAFTDPMLTRCGQIMAEVCDKFGATLTEFTGETDHVHLLIHYPPTVQLSTLVNSLKGVSARYLRQEFPDHIQKYLWGNHFWSPSYFAASAGGAPLAIVAEYITNQQRPEPTPESDPATRDPAIQNQLPPGPQGPGFL
ncbi:IS200/IS605 family transposase [Rhodococcus koreensis]|uniref:Putative transposase n=1 Tax=Rhodococcus koreensis TaxID=99653 RepID=A0A1H4MVD8_9NOCA|nr:IS200/IS605 family transposase [Rhodococcus koreensis]SEB86475.1 putative transposase [Rhodococcus koreensis]